MADYRELMRVLERKKGGRPVLFEPDMSRPLYERLVWRSGDTPWRDSLSTAQVIIDASRICSFDCACLSFGRLEGELRLSLDEALLEQVSSMLPQGMGIIDRGAASPLELFSQHRGEEKCIRGLLSSYYEPVLACPSVCAVMIRDPAEAAALPFCETRSALLPYYRELCQMIHGSGKRCVYSAEGSFSKSLEFALEAGFDGIRYFPGGDTVEDAWQKYHGDIALLGGIPASFLSAAKPLAIHSHCDALMRLTGGQAFALGSDNFRGEDIPYLGFISLAGFVESRAREHNARG